MPVWKIALVLRQFLALRETQRTDLSRVTRMAFEAARAGSWGTPMLYGLDKTTVPFGPHTNHQTCAICGPIPPATRRDWCHYNGVFWVFCHQCSDAWRDDGNGKGPSRVAVLLEQALAEVERLREGILPPRQQGLVKLGLQQLLTIRSGIMLDYELVEDLDAEVRAVLHYLRVQSEYADHDGSRTPGRPAGPDAGAARAPGGGPDPR